MTCKNSVKTHLELRLLAEDGRALVTMPGVCVNREVVPAILRVAANGDVALLAAVDVVHVDNVVAHGRGRVELAAAVGTQVGFLLFKAGLQLKGIIVY